MTVYRNNSENVLVEGNDNNRKNNIVISSGGPIEFDLGYALDRTYDVGFNATEHDGNSTSVEHNCVFYKSIYIKDNKLRRDGISKYGVRYYWIPLANGEGMTNNLNSIGINVNSEDVYAVKGTIDVSWKSIHTIMYKDKEEKFYKLAAYEITDHLDNPNNEKELPWDKDEYKDKTHLF